MEPTLRDGDWLLVDPDAYRSRRPAPGELVVAHDPRLPARIIVKRVSWLDFEGRLRLAGDHPSHAADADKIGLVSPAAVIGRPWLRYWPLDRFGPLD